MISYCTSNSNSESVNDCRFLSNLASGESPDGAAGLISSNTYNPGFTNCYFYNSTAGCGGALFLYYPNYIQNSYPLQFCLFKDNTGTTGNDIAITMFSPDNNTPPLRHCLSTSNSPRVGYSDTEWHKGDFNWLPQTCNLFSRSENEQNTRKSIINVSIRHISQIPAASHLPQSLTPPTPSTVSSILDSQIKHLSLSLLPILPSLSV